MSEKKPLTPEKIRKLFRDEYVGTQGIYMTGLGWNGLDMAGKNPVYCIVAFVMEEDVKSLSLPTEYMGLPVIHRVQPNGWGNGKD